MQRPGAYDISALSTPLNAVYTAGGPTDAGSLRVIRHYRGKNLVQEVDAYDLLLHGVRGDVLHLEPGDTILVPPIGPQVTVQGMVRRPAIYEIHGEKSLAEVLELSGGVMSSGTLRHIEVERIDAHERNTMLSLDLPETNDQTTVNKQLESFNIQDGDRVRVAPILPYSYKTVYLDGHVFHPIARQSAALEHLLASLLHGWDELIRDRAADDAVNKGIVVVRVVVSRTHCLEP